jgi:hypothetical protein
MDTKHSGLLGLCCLLAACASSPGLPKMLPISADYYPNILRRFGAEARVLVEFRLNERRRAVDSVARQWDLFPLEPLDETPPWRGIPPAVLGRWATKVILSMRFDPSDPTRTDPKRTYRVTVVFCLEPPGNCGGIRPYPATDEVIVRAPRWERD